MTKLKAVGPAPTAENFERLTRYVRVRGETASGFIEFDFAIGDPSLYVELVLPKGAFDIFCERNGVVFMSEEEAAAVDADMEKWRYGDLRRAADE
ncbi:MAG TPA: phenol hydroxylase [Halieaceae bacterium]|nr:phenol hydroxylase [Halieaceae bacterium]